MPKTKTKTTAAKEPSGSQHQTLQLILGTLRDLHLAVTRLEGAVYARPVVRTTSISPTTELPVNPLCDISKEIEAARREGCLPLAPQLPQKNPLEDLRKPTMEEWKQTFQESIPALDHIHNSGWALLNKDHPSSSKTAIVDPDPSEPQADVGQEAPKVRKARPPKVKKEEEKPVIAPVETVPVPSSDPFGLGL